MGNSIAVFIACAVVAAVAFIAYKRLKTDARPIEPVLVAAIAAMASFLIFKPTNQPQSASVDKAPSVAIKQNDKPQPALPDNNTPTPQKQEAKPQPQQQKENWRVTSDTDAMSGKISKWASTMSVATIDAAAKTPKSATALVKEGDANWSSSFRIGVDRGTIHCGYYSECQIRVKFDNDAPAFYTAKRVSNDIHYVIEFSYNPSLLRELHRSKVMLIELPFYGTGSAIYKFDIEGLPL